MTSDPVDEYAKAVQAEKAARAAVEHMLKVVQVICETVCQPHGRTATPQDWRTIRVTNVGLDWSRASAMNRGPVTVDGNIWPDAKTMGETLLAWHEAVRLARAAYDTLPAHIQAVIGEAPPQ